MCDAMFEPVPQTSSLPESLPEAQLYSSASPDNKRTLNMNDSSPDNKPARVEREVGYWLQMDQLDYELSEWYLSTPSSNAETRGQIHMKALELLLQLSGCDDLTATDIQQLFEWADGWIRLHGHGAAGDPHLAMLCRDDPLVFSCHTRDASFD